MLHQLVYISSATKTFEQHELERLLATARRRNEQNGVTGVLLHDDFSFLQVLEGAPEVLARTLARIRRDPRHTGLIVVQDVAVAERDFGAWDMASCHVQRNDLRQVAAARKLDQGFIRDLAAQISQPVAQIFVTQFGVQALR